MPKRNGKFRQLRAAMYADDVRQRELAKIIERSDNYVSVRMSAKMPFDLVDVYRICDYLNLPYAEIPRYFPPLGVALKESGGGTS